MSVSFWARVAATLSAGATIALLGACSQTPVTVDLHSLQASGRVSFVCRADDESPAGHALDECPDYDSATRRVYGLVTQTATNEVAIVDLYGGTVVDVDPTTPGYSFLRVGGSPGSIVSTPGGAASFVGVKGLNKNGIFALPTTCLGPPKPTEAARDLTSWAACSLTSAPGEITVLVDPAQNGTVSASCGGAAETTPDTQMGRTDCAADLTREAGPKGRRKLLVSLPEEHQLVLIDAQRLLDRAPGEFTGCEIEKYVPLTGAPAASALDQVLPDDLKIDTTKPGANVCVPTTYPPPDPTAAPTPDGFALSGDTLYVADRTLPVVHTLDVSKPCAITETKPLLPYSYEDPSRVVTTSRIAVSPVTPSGLQFVYAVDFTDPTAASVMVFDVSPTPPPKARAQVAARMPVIFPRGPKEPYLSPDRLRFGPNVQDVTFVQRDFPQADMTTGVGQFGESCDPTPGSTSPGTKFRSNSDYSDGARPVNLRGLFGFALLSDGHVAIIDVDDFDADCRRPMAANVSTDPTLEDFRGCLPTKGVPADADPATYFSEAGVPTVTNESSCNVVEPNRPRSASLSISSSTVGLRAPTLRAFPQFSNPDPSALLNGNQRPHMLAVDFSDPAGGVLPAQVNVSAQLYAHCPTTPNASLAPPCDGSAQLLPFDLTEDPQNSLVLPIDEPRSYSGDETRVLTYEGPVLTKPSTSGFIHQDTPTDASAILQDPDASFCSSGVEDSVSILTEADSLGIPAKSQDDWAKAHADYVQINSDFLPDDDVYWTVGAGQRCPKQACINEFGTIDDLTQLSASRDLKILHAFGDHLEIEPRCQLANGQPDATCNPATVLQDISCCFPTGSSYTVRASHQWLLSGPGGVGVASHDLANFGSDNHCVHTATCNPLKQYFHSRAFEVCQTGADHNLNGQTCDATDATVGCVASPSQVPVGPSGPASQCVFQNLTSRFAVYRGDSPSTRDMTFSWQTTGGFTPLTMSIATSSTQVLPTSMSYLPEQGYLAVIDSATLGLSLFDLNSLGVVTPSPFF